MSYRESLTDPKATERGEPDDVTKACQTRLDPERIDDHDLIAPACYVMKSRNARRRYFPDGFFRPMTFDLLLDLFVHRVRGETVFVKQVIATSGLPQTSALRQIDRLEAFELVDRAPYENDHRMIVLDLTEKGWGTMRNFLRSIMTDADIDIDLDSERVIAS